MPSPQPSPDRLIALVQYDRASETKYVAELPAGLSNAELARMICAGDQVADCPILIIRELFADEGVTADVTEDVAREIENVADTANDERWPIQNCAAAMLHRFKLRNAVEDRETAEYLNQRQVAA